MIHSLKNTTLFPILLIAAFTVPAAEARPRAEKRQKNQVSRIKEGRQSGQLNTRESRRLGEAAKGNRDAAREARSDGEVTAEEKADLENRQDALSKQVYKQKHDGQTQDGVDPAEPTGASRAARRTGRQGERIEDGMASGELNRRESKRLRQARLDNAKAIRDANEDGVVTPEEKADLERRQDELSKQIYAEKHDGQERGSNDLDSGDEAAGEESSADGASSSGEESATPSSDDETASPEAGSTSDESND